MAKKNIMHKHGKDINNAKAYLTIHLADSKTEVRGFGQPVTRRKTKEMAEAYFKTVEDAWALVKEIEQNKTYASLKKTAGFKSLKSLVDPKQHVSGVFGKEVIMQLLSLRHCEGIRYILGRDGKANTVILAGVNEVDSLKKDNAAKAKSALVATHSLAAAVADDGTADDGGPFDTEVHDEGTTIEETRALLG